VQAPIPSVCTECKCVSAPHFLCTRVLRGQKWQVHQAFSVRSDACFFVYVINNTHSTHHTHGVCPPHIPAPHPLLLLIGVSLPSGRSTVVHIFYAGVVRSRSGSSSFTASALNKPSRASGNSRTSAYSTACAFCVYTWTNLCMAADIFAF